MFLLIKRKIIFFISRRKCKNTADFLIKKKLTKIKKVNFFKKFTLFLKNSLLSNTKLLEKISIKNLLLTSIIIKKLLSSIVNHPKIIISPNNLRHYYNMNTNKKIEKKMKFSFFIQKMKKMKKLTKIKKMKIIFVA